MLSIDKAYRKVRGAVVRVFHNIMAAMVRTISRFFYAVFHTRPGLKRGALVLALYALGAVGAALLGGGAATAFLWALMLLMLFLGMGAERAAVEWSPVFALPPLNAFAFWRWHALERKRFTAVLAALVMGCVCTFVVEVAL